MIEGYLEVARPFQFRGWAFSPDNPEMILKILISVGDRVIATGDADLFREDLLENGIGSGKHAFVINTFEAEQDDALEKAKAYAILDGVPTLLERHISSEPFKASLKRVFSAPLSQGTTQRPVFVLGAARSGTSAIAQALLKSGKYSGEEEGFLFELLPILIQQIDDYYESKGEESLSIRNTLLARVPAIEIKKQVRTIFSDITVDLYQNIFWVDKTPTPGAIRSSLEIAKVYPDALFIFLKRRGLENIESRLRKFPTLDFASHCSDWNAAMLAWDDIKENLAGRYLTVDMYDLAARPDQTSVLICSFLRMDDQNGMRFFQALKTDFPERTINGSYHALSFDNMSWSTAMKRDFLEICGTAMEKFGYSYDENYYSPRHYQED